MEWIKKILLLFVLLAACHDDCQPAESKCENETLYVCNVKQEWEKSISCSDIEAIDPSTNWVCCEDPEDGEFSCLPEGDCK